MKTIKALLAIVIAIASISFAKAQDSSPKYHLHDNAYANNNHYTGSAYVVSNFTPTDAKYHLHDIGLPPSNNTYATELKSDFVSLDAKYHFHDPAVQLTTATITVYGECGFCKQHIENAAKINGVSSAKWDVKTNLLTIQYNNKVTNVDKIQQSEAAFGHDTQKYKATDVAYNSLPRCCHYRRE